MRLFKGFNLFVIVLLVASAALAACAVSPQLATCAYIVGKGTGGYDAKVHKVVYPGQKVSYTGDDDGNGNGVGEVVRYVPCNSRNYIINDGTILNANGEKVGDRGTLTKATTSSGTQITVASTALWTLNQSGQAMRNFYTVCFKYTCYSENDQGGGVNFATPGWNGMLSENFGSAIDAALRRAAAEVTDGVWQTHEPAQYKALAELASTHFAEEVRARFGFSDDLFCGSGNSKWMEIPKPGQETGTTKETAPGEGSFYCSPVRIIVEDVEVLQIATGSGTQAQADLNAARLAAAEKLYGPDAACFLGLQDTVDKCTAHGATCIVNLNGDVCNSNSSNSSSNQPTIVLPSQPAATAGPEPTTAP